MHLHGPEVGRPYDVLIFGRNGLHPELTSFININCKQYVVFADSGYYKRIYMVCRYSGTKLRPAQKAFNTGMPRNRVTMEYMFKSVKLIWTMMDENHKLRLWQRPLRLYYKAAVHLIIFRNAVYPNQISQYFRCKPPSLIGYVDMGVE